MGRVAKDGLVANERCFDLIKRANFREAIDVGIVFHRRAIRLRTPSVSRGRAFFVDALVPPTNDSVEEGLYVVHPLNCFDLIVNGEDHRTGIRAVLRNVTVIGNGFPSFNLSDARVFV